MRAREIAIAVVAVAVGAAVATLVRSGAGTTGPSSDVDSTAALRDRVAELERRLAERPQALEAAPRRGAGLSSDGTARVPREASAPSDGSNGESTSRLASDLQTLPFASSIEKSAWVQDWLHNVSAYDRARTEPARPPLEPYEIRRLLDSGTREDLATALAAIGRAHDASFLPALTEQVNRPERRDDASSIVSTIAALKDHAWSAIQATGAPDTPIDGDLGTAWASKREDMGLVTLELEYERAVRVDAVRVHETLNPGAVARVEARAADGTWTAVWEGVARPGPSPTWFAPPVRPTPFATTAIRLVVDTDRVPGWNEIDAVELVGDGLSQWASKATASSSYADP